MIAQAAVSALEQAFALLRCDGRDAVAHLTERIEADVVAGNDTAALAQMSVLMAIEEILVELAAQSADRMRHNT